ncbi:hypothetical protein DTO012A7_6851 [Penicillium roqueforti]|nr:hypothetical protein CBS147355_7060 [Penicillium roqueforti]KAI2683894.1 hypothetical protein LCP963914a_5724 [Penicillium roqueforti]KAI2696827.1 hypothetical protein CBS147372_8246 [Penicillium roqueforti]KAI2710974.1 hypothetical protein CBS147318_8354 [Penicillium roqueforti]KAI2714337.1 hypothetical protein CBS147354_7506 [Penicillium roqueforti]
MSTSEKSRQSNIDAPQLPFEVDGLYILLSNRGDKSYTFHWSLYLHQSPKLGSVYHLLNDIDTSTWRFEHLPNESVIYDQALLVALKIGVLNPILHMPFLDRLRQIPIVDSVRFRERITCRVWLKEALFALDDEGYIMLTRSVDDIEAEARNLALQNKSLGRRTIVKSGGSQA